MKFCPHCGENIGLYLSAEGTGILPQPLPSQSVSVQRKYDQTRVWKMIMQKSQEIKANPPDITQLALSAATGLAPHLKNGPLSAVVHMVFDRDIVPQGGILYQAAMRDGRMDGSEDQFRSLGYGLSDGKVELVDDVPVGPAFGILNYWGGDKQYRRWHLSSPVNINPSRNGDRFFMDENMIAFGVQWADGERLEEGLLELLGLFENGIGGSEVVAKPIALEVVGLSS